MRARVTGIGGACLLAAVAMLAACGSKQEEPAGSKSMDEIKQEVSQIERPEPGQYKQTIEVTQMDIPGLPKEAADQMKAMMAKTQIHDFCLTKEEADKGFRDMFNDVGKKDGQCSFTKFDVDGGNLDARMDCKSEQGPSGVITLQGTVKSTGSDVRMAMDMTGGSQPAGTMKMKMHMTTERTGDCQS